MTALQTSHPVITAGSVAETDHWYTGVINRIHEPRRTGGWIRKQHISEKEETK